MDYEGAGWSYDCDEFRNVNPDTYVSDGPPDWWLASRAGLSLEEYRRQERIRLGQAWVDQEFGPLNTVTGIPDDLEGVA